jgi:DNA-binding NarL/FixJ family response regulator
MSRVRILIVDDHAVVRAGLRLLLSADAEIEIVGEAGDGAEALRMTRDLNPDVVLMDISMPDMNGIEATRKLRDAAPGAKVVLLTMYGDPLHVADAVAAGAAGFVLKRDAPEDLMRAIRRVVRGELAIPDVNGSRQNNKVLSSRQREILQLVAEGHTLKEIATLLGISIKTVEFHKYRVMRILAVRSTAELTAVALRYGMVAS